MDRICLGFLGCLGNGRQQVFLSHGTEPGNAQSFREFCQIRFSLRLEIGYSYHLRNSEFVFLPIAQPSETQLAAGVL